MHPRRLTRTSALLGALCLVATAWIGSARAHGPEGHGDDPQVEGQGVGERTVRIPADDVGIATLGARAQREKLALERHGVEPGFRLTDRLPETGITFVHQIVDDAGKEYKLVHYDHGNGLALADVDGDGLPDLYFVNQLGGNELWRNLGEGRFEDITARAGVAVADRVSVSASFGDLNNNGRPDLFVTTVRGGNLLFENLGDGRFRDVTEQAGVGYVGHSSGVVFLDFDRDGLLDVFVTNVGEYTTDERGRGGYFVGRPDAFSGHLFPERRERSILYRNRGGLRFQDVSEAVGLVDHGWSGDAAAVDFDRDGYPELYVLNMQGDDSYWVNLGGERFEERGRRHFPETSWGAMGIAVLDHDGDGRMDLVITDMHSDMSEGVPPEREHLKSTMRWTAEELGGGEDSIFGNTLFRNRGPSPEGIRFEEVSDRAGVETYWPWGVSSGDLDADGFEDLFVTNSMSFPFRYQPDALLLNHRGERFLHATFELAVEPRRDGTNHVPWFTVDCSGEDGKPGRRPLCQGREGSWTVEGTLGSRSSAFVDLDRDGDLDLVVTDFGAAPRIYFSDLAQRRELRSLELRLEGAKSNRDGLGAFVTVHAGGRELVRFHHGKSGYLSQSSLPLYIGLGEAETVDRIDVLWPSGIEQTVPGPIAPNRLLVVREELPAAAPEAAEEDPAGS